jgi:hypothetical protein
MERHLGVIEVSLMGHLILSIFKMKYYYVRFFCHHTFCLVKSLT